MTVDVGNAKRQARVACPRQDAHLAALHTLQQRPIQLRRKFGIHMHAGVRSAFHWGKSSI